MNDQARSDKEPNDEAITTENSFSSEREIKVTGGVDTADMDLPQLKEQLAQMEERYLRTAAEFENFKKRSVRQSDDIVHFAEAKVFNDVLEIVDNFKRALELPDNQQDSEAFKKGMQLIYGQMKEFLNKHKIEAINSVGKQFDPELHEAIMQIESDEHPEGVIASEMSAGFKKGNKVIRYAKVGVSTGKSKKE